MPAPDDVELAELGHLNYQEFGRELSRLGGAGGAVLEEGGLVLHTSASAFPVLFNGVWRVDPTVPGSEVIARADAHFGERGRGYSVTVRDDDARDADLAAAAEDAGLLSILSSPEMVCRTRLDDQPVPAGATLRWVADQRSLDDFVTVSDLAYSSVGMEPGAVAEAICDVDRVTAPHVHTVVAYLDGAPVAAAMVLLSHSISGVYWVGTTEPARGSGLGEAVTRAVTNRAFDDGARAVTLQASPMGEPIYLRMGYESLYRYSTWVCFV